MGRRRYGYDSPAPRVPRRWAFCFLVRRLRHAPAAGRQVSLQSMKGTSNEVRKSVGCDRYGPDSELRGRTGGKRTLPQGQPQDAGTSDTKLPAACAGQGADAVLLQPGPAAGAERRSEGARGCDAQRPGGGEQGAGQTAGRVLEEQGGR